MLGALGQIGRLVVKTFERTASWQRLRRCRRFSFATSNIRRAILCILVRRLDNRCGLVRIRRFEHSLQERHTPATTSPGSTAFTDLAGDTRTVNPQEIRNLALTDMEAVADFVIGLDGVFRIAFVPFSEVLRRHSTATCTVFTSSEKISVSDA